MRTIKAYLSLLTSVFSGLLAWISDNITLEFFSGSAAIVASVFACIHFYHSWELKRVEKKIKQEEYEKIRETNPNEKPPDYQSGGKSSL